VDQVNIIDQNQQEKERKKREQSELVLIQEGHQTLNQLLQHSFQIKCLAGFDPNLMSLIVEGIHSLGALGYVGLVH